MSVRYLRLVNEHMQETMLRFIESTHKSNLVRLPPKEDYCRGLKHNIVSYGVYEKIVKEKHT